MENFSQSQPFNSTRNIATWAIISLGFLAMLDIVNVIANSTELILASRYPETVEASLLSETADFTEMPGGWFQTTVGLITVGLAGFYVLGTLTTIVVFLIWMRRSYLNLKPLGIKRTEYSASWAIGCWFVPLVNLVRPYGIIKEIWSKSDPDSVEMESSSFAATLQMVQVATPLFGLWWGFWISSNVFNNVSTRLSFGAETLDQHVTSFWLALISSLLSIAAAILAIGVIRGITARQEERHKRIVASTQMAPYNHNAPPMPPTYAPQNPI